jgi:hypothetical protein
MSFLSKKRFIRTLLTIYTISYILNSLFFVDFKKVFAEDSIRNTNLIAIFVDQKTYDQNQNNIQRYASEYIQNKISDSKTIVFPIQSNNFKALDIVKILENLYFD